MVRGPRRPGPQTQRSSVPRHHRRSAPGKGVRPSEGWGYPGSSHRGLGLQGGR